MVILRFLQKQTTGTYTTVAFSLGLLSVLLRGISKPMPYEAAAAASAVELSALSAFVLAYGMFWVLVLIGPFRPYNVFTREGKHRKRWVNFCCAFTGLVAVHVCLAWAKMTARL